MEPTLNDVVTMSEDVLFRELDDEAVLLNLKTGIYFGLNPVGTRVWQLLAEHRVLSRVLEAVASEYDVERDVLEQDLLQLARQLYEAGLCQPAPST